MTHTHSPANPPFVVASPPLCSCLARHLENLPILRGLSLRRLILCLQRILPGIVRVEFGGSFCGDYFGSNGLSRQCPMPTSTKYKAPAQCTMYNALQCTMYNVQCPPQLSTRRQPPDTRMQREGSLTYFDSIWEFFVSLRKL